MFNNIILQFEEHDRRIFWILGGLLALVLASYVYFLGVSVYAVIARKQAQLYTGKINSQISQLESQYVALDRNINLALAHERGFSDISVPRYVSPEAPQKTFTLLAPGPQQ